MRDDNFEYAIKKDIKNNPIIREVDRNRHLEMWRTVGISVFLVSVVLFSAWQHFEQLRYGYRLEQVERERLAEAELNGHLRLEVETLSAPDRIERLATERLGMVAPASTDTAIIERVAPPPPSIVAQR
jgi:cell division protein FtsL